MKPVAVKNARILTCGSGAIPKVIEKGTILWAGGKITAVGTDIEVPTDATVFDALDKVITPGLIDIHCHIGIAEDGAGWAGQDGNESTDPVTAEVRALDGINPKDVAFRDAVRAGITCVQVDPGSANIIGGETLVMKTWGTVVDDLVIRRPSGLKAALGENPKRVYGTQRKMPATRMGNAAVLRKALTAARDYLRKIENAKEPDKAPDLNLRGTMIGRGPQEGNPLRVHCHRADDIMTAIRIARSSTLTYPSSTAPKDLVGEYVRDSGYPVTLGPSLTDKEQTGSQGHRLRRSGSPVKLGVKLAIITDHPSFPSSTSGSAPAFACVKGWMRIPLFSRSPVTPPRSREWPIGSAHWSQAKTRIWSSGPKTRLSTMPRPSAPS